MSGKKSNPYRTTGKPEKSNEPLTSPAPPARKYMSKRTIAGQPGAVAMVGGRPMLTDEMEFGTEDDLPTNVARNLIAEEADAEAPPPSQPAPQKPAPPQVSQRSSQPHQGVTAVQVDEDAENRKIEERLAKEKRGKTFLWQNQSKKFHGGRDRLQSVPFVSFCSLSSLWPSPSL